MLKTPYILKLGLREMDINQSETPFPFGLALITLWGAVKLPMEKRSH